MTAMSNIRVFVQWAEQTVFAGEDIECQITFKNIAIVPNSQRPSPQIPNSNGFAPAGERLKTPQISNVPLKNHLPNSRGVSPSTRAHRPSVSLSVSSINGRSPRGIPSSERAGHSKANAGGNQHKRSLSIISMGASEDTANGARSETGELLRRPTRGHGRAASLQILPGRNGSVDIGPLTAPMSRHSTHPALGSRGTSPSTSPRFPDAFSSRRNPGMASAPNTPGRSHSRKGGSKNSPMTPHNFKFPASPRELQSLEIPKYTISPTKSPELGGSTSSKIGVDIPIIMEQTTPPASRILSPSSISGTPRSSGEFYSQSNNSTETLASEYLPQQGGRIWARPPHIRKQSNLVPSNHRSPETLMMGYAQINGTFTLDGSLINQAPFEEVKRKGVVGGQGGGVVGLETGKRDGGLLGAFGWGNFGQSLGGLLGGNELSSIKDMRGLASTRSIPLLSTPQSILFVDLRLAPGESKTYKYSFKLPKGLPPTHRGKTIKVSYHLVIGTQRPGGAKEQQVKSVEIPFRLLGSVNDHGELLGHDLMSPYIILRDQAQVQSLDHIHSSLKNMPKHLNTPKVPPESSLDDFLAYVDELLERPRKNSSMGLLSPTATVPGSRRPSSFNEIVTAKEAIDMAILRSNITTRSQQSANRFEIARNGRRVAVIMLARPAWRLGETITAAIDFTDADIPCYALHASLETSEKVDAAIALRSNASIHRVTRKIHATQSESSLFARRIVFSPTIPITATPAFITSGISLEWKIRIEFVTPILQERQDLRNNQNNDDDSLDGSSTRSSVDYSRGGNSTMEDGELLEEVSRDERGVVLAAVEQLRCESFEIAVPILVYGAVGSGVTERSDRDGDGGEGLVV